MEKDRNFSLDVIRALAILMVLLIHLFYPVYNNPNFVGLPAWWGAHIINSISRVCIPLFIILSGYLLLCKDEGISDALKRIFWRIFVPLMIWTYIYLAWESAFRNTQFTQDQILEGLFSGGMFHLYYLVITLSLYLMLPIYRQTVKVLDQKSWKYLLFLLLGGSLVSTYINFKYLQNYASANSFTISFYYLGYFFLGGFIKKVSVTQNYMKLLLGSFLIFSLLTIIFHYQNMLDLSLGERGLWRDISYFENYTSFNVMGAGISLFLLLLSLDYTHLNQYLKRLISFVSSLSYPMYLSHLLIIGFVDRILNMEKLLPGSLFEYLTIRAVSAITLTIIVSYGLVNIPLIRKSVGVK